MKPAVIIELDNGDGHTVTEVGDVKVVVLDWEEIENDLDAAHEAFSAVSHLKGTTLSNDPAMPALVRLYDRLDGIIDELAADEEEEDEEEDEDEEDS
jgi:hypothetical protein